MTNKKTLEKRLNEKEKELVNYHPISANTEYDRKTFVDAQKKLGDLGEYVQALEKDPYHLGAREDLFDLLLGDSAKHIGKSPEVVRKIGNSAYSDGIEHMGRYIERNYDSAMNKIDGNGLMDLVRSVPLYKTSNKEYRHEKITKDEEHNELVDLINEIRLMNSDNEETRGKIANHALAKVIQSKEVPDWVKNLIQYFDRNDMSFSKEIFMRYKAGREQAFTEHITKEGHVDKEKLKSLIDTSLKVAYAEFNDLDEKKNKGERKDIWEKAIRPCYLETSKVLYKSEKKELEGEDEEKRKKNERKAQRRTLGIAA